MGEEHRFNLFVTEPITKVQINSPYNEREGRYENSCRLETYTDLSSATSGSGGGSDGSNDSFSGEEFDEYSLTCSPLMLSATSDGDIVTCQFNVTLIGNVSFSAVVTGLSVPTTADPRDVLGGGVPHMVFPRHGYDSYIPQQQQQQQQQFKCEGHFAFPSKFYVK